MMFEYYPGFGLWDPSKQVFEGDKALLKSRVAVLLIALNLPHVILTSTMSWSL